jgi:hypothetical protein
MIVFVGLLMNAPWFSANLDSAGNYEETGGKSQAVHDGKPLAFAEDAVGLVPMVQL